MSCLRKAAEMALEALMQTTLEDVMVEVEPNVWEYKSIIAIQALRQALAEEALDRMDAENQRLGLYDEDNLQTAIEKGTKAWADVPNATEWAEELRGYDTPEVTPEGWVKIDEVRQYFDSVGCGTIYKTAGEDRVPLYAAPPKKEWVGLTDREIEHELTQEFAHWWNRHVSVCRAIETKLKDKNT